MAIERQIEPGVLQVFRLFVGIELCLFSVSLLFGARRSDASVPNYAALFHVVQSIVMLIYLSWGGLHRLLGASYLPLALLIASVGPILGQAATTALRLRAGIPAAGALLDPGSLYVWLLPPLLLIGAQYGYKAVVLFTGATSLLALLLALPFLRFGGGIVVSMVSGAGVRLLLFTLVGVTVARLSLAQRSLRDELAQQNDKLAHYAATLEELAVSRERNRLARELHDTLAHTLSAVSIQLKAIDVQLDGDLPAARNTVHQAQGVTTTGLNEVRRALFALRANPIETLGFVGALRQTAEHIAAHANVQVQLDLPVLGRELRPEVEQQLFRITEEALHNSVRHAQARCVTLRLCATATDLQVTVADDGVGFDPAAPAKQGHYGLTGMHERARLVNAELQIRSHAGHGTQVHLRMLLKEHHL